MKKQNTILIAVIVVLLLAVGLYLFASKKPASVQTLQSQQTAMKPTAPTSKAETLQTSLKNLLSMGKTVKCTFTSTVKDVTVNGTVETANGKMKQDFTSNTKVGAMNGHMIVDGTNAYMWTDQMKQGYKFALSEMPTPPAGATTSQSQGADINKSVTMSCLPWTSDPAAFTPPADVTFQTMKIPAMPKVSPGANAMMPADKCAVCNNLPEGVARNSCKAQLQCK